MFLVLKQLDACLFLSLRDPHPRNLPVDVLLQYKLSPFDWVH